MAEITLYLISTVGTIIIGLLTYIKNPRRATNVLFFILTMTIAAWASTTYFSNQAEADLLVWVRAVITVGALLNFFVFLTLYVFPSEKLNIPAPLFWISLVATAGVAILNQTSYVFSGLTPITNQPVAGPLLPLFLLQTFLLLGGGFVVLVRKYRRAVGVLKSQLGLLLVGITTTFALIIATNLILVVFFGDITFVSLGPAYTIVFVGLTSYAIIKQQLLDIRLVLMRILVYGALLTAIAGGYAAGVLLITSRIGVEFRSVGALMLFVAALISFEPIRHIFTRLADRLLYSGQYNPDDLARRLGQVGSATIVLEQLGRGILHELQVSLRLDYAHLVVFKKNKPYYQTAVKQPGIKRAERLATEVISRLHTSGFIMFDELSEGKQRAWLRTAGITVSVPLRVENEIVALLVLGNKLTGAAMSIRDKQFFERIGPPIALAVQNAKAYEEISRFAETLKKEVVRATTDLRTANVKLEELNDMKSNFVSIASHQLRAPIGGVRGYLSMLRDGDYGRLPAKPLGIIEQSMTALDHTLRVIEMFLDVTKMESGKIELARKPTNLLEVVHDVEHELADSAERKGLRLTIKLPATLPTLSLDAEKIRNVIFNLVENSVKYTEEGSVAVVVRKTKDAVECSVTDTGIGIAPEEVPKLFAKFVRAGGGFKVSHGSGLGLYIIKTLIEAHGGTVFVQSSGEGKGSTFGFRLPFR